MTVPADSRRREYIGNGVTTVFNGPMAFQSSHVQVFRVSEGPLGPEEHLIPSGQYSVDYLGRVTGTRVVFSSPVPNGQKIVMLRTMPYTQEVSIENQGAFHARTVEDGYDALGMQIQQLADGVDRSLRIPDSWPPGVDTRFPFPEASRLIGWNYDGSALRNTDPSGPGDLSLRSDLADPIGGAGLVAFRQAGANAVLRNTGAKLLEQPKTPEDFGAVGDGVADDTTAMRRFLTAGGGDLRPGATYLVSGVLDMPSNSRLSCIRGRAAIRLAAGSNATVIRAVGASNLTLENIEVDGNEAQQASGLFYGIYLDGCSGITLRNVYSHDSVYPNVRLRNCTRISVDTLDCARSPAEGLKVTNCSDGEFRSISTSEIPYTVNHAAIGAVAGVQVDDGSNNLTFQQVTCVSDGASDSAKGFDISTHPGEPITHNIRIKGLTTELCGNGLSVSSGSSNVMVEGHDSKNDRISLALRDCSYVTVSDINYVSDSGAHNFVGSSYGLGISGTTKGIAVKDGSITTDGRPVYFDATASQADDWKLESLDLSGVGAAGTWARFTASPGMIDVLFRKCHFRGSAGNLLSLGVNTAVYADARIRFDDCDFHDAPGLTGALLTNNIPNLSVDSSRFHLTAHDAVNLQSRRTRIKFKDTAFVGIDGTRVAFNIGNGVQHFSAHDCYFENLARGLVLTAGSSGASAVGVDFNGCSFVDMASAVFRVLGTGDDRYVDNMTIGGNKFINSPSVYQGFPLGANATNVVAYNNNPAAPIPA